MVGDREFTVEPADTPAARDFVTHLPLSLAFDEPNGSEKFAYLDASLPTQSTNLGTIHKGDVMPFEDNCLTVTYDTIPTNYQYEMKLKSPLRAQSISPSVRSCHQKPSSGGTTKSE